MRVLNTVDIGRIVSLDAEHMFWPYKAGNKNVFVEMTNLI